MEGKSGNIYHELRLCLAVTALKRLQKKAELLSEICSLLVDENECFHGVDKQRRCPFAPSDSHSIHAPE